MFNFWGLYKFAQTFDGRISGPSWATQLLKHLLVATTTWLPGSLGSGDMSIVFLGVLVHNICICIYEFYEYILFALYQYFLQYPFCETIANMGASNHILLLVCVVPEFSPPSLQQSSSPKLKSLDGMFIWVVATQIFLFRPESLGK